MKIVSTIGALFAKYKDAVPVSESWQEQLLELHNKQRGVRRGNLTIDPHLTVAAQGHADWMAQTGIMSHSGMYGSDMAERIQNAGYKGGYLGENIAYGYPTVQSVMEGWMQSYGHRMNIMSPNYTQVGFGRGTHSDGTVFWCADFGRPN
jgi:uncharacterized protein YkwD